MVVWRSLVSRTVYLHTGTMGVHRACFDRLGSESHSPRAESPRKIVSLSCAAFLLSRTNWRAPGKNDAYTRHTDRGEGTDGDFLKIAFRRGYSVDNFHRNVCHRGSLPWIGPDGASSHAHDPATHR